MHLQGIRVKRPPSGAGLTGIRALSLVLASKARAQTIIDCASCQHLQQLRVREDRSIRQQREDSVTLYDPTSDPRAPVSFVPPLSAAWTQRLTLLDLGYLEMRQMAPLPALTSLICSLPPGDLPARQLPSPEAPHLHGQPLARSLAPQRLCAAARA